MANGRTTAGRVSVYLHSTVGTSPATTMLADPPTYTGWTLVGMNSFDESGLVFTSGENFDEVMTNNSPYVRHVFRTGVTATLAGVTKAVGAAELAVAMGGTGTPTADISSYTGLPSMTATTPDATLGNNQIAWTDAASNVHGYNAIGAPGLEVKRYSLAVVLFSSPYEVDHEASGWNRVYWFPNAYQSGGVTITNAKTHSSIPFTWTALAHGTGSSEQLYQIFTMWKAGS